MSTEAGHEYSASALSAFRLLILSPALPSIPSPISPLLEALTGTKPTLDQVRAGFAGYTQHPPLQIRTKYYNSNVATWCDEVPLLTQSAFRLSLSETEVKLHDLDRLQGDSNALDGVSSTVASTRTTADGDAQSEEVPTLPAWRIQMLSDAALEVRGVIGGIVLALPMSFSPTTSVSKQVLPDGYLDVVEAVNELRDVIEEEGHGRDVASVILLMGTGKEGESGGLGVATEKMEEVLLEERGILGWDIVRWEGAATEKAEVNGARNAYGEKIGIERVKELLESIDWSAPLPSIGKEDNDLGFLSSEYEDAKLGVDGLKLQGQELEQEMMGLKLAMRDHDFDGDIEEEDLQVDQLPRLLDRVVAIKEAGLEMSKSDREKFAKREVDRIMKEIT